MRSVHLYRIADFAADVCVRDVETCEQYGPQFVDVSDFCADGLTSQHVDEDQRRWAKKRYDLPASPSQLAVDVRQPDGG